MTTPAPKSSSTNVGSVQLNTVATVNTSTTVATTTTTQNTTNISTTATANTVTLGENSYMYMRAKTIQFTAQGLKPNTRYYPFFNNVDVSGYCTTSNSTVTSSLVSNSIGDLVGNFYLPAGKFLAGSHTFTLVDNVRTVSGVTVPDPLYGKIEAQYEANGVLKQQQTQVTVNSAVNTSNVTTTVSKVDTTTQAKLSTTVNVTLPPVPVPDPPPVVQCESWFFEYAVVSGSSQTKLFTVTTNSATPPATSAVNTQSGATSVGVVLASIRYVSTTAAGSNTWYHTFSGRLTIGGTSSSVTTYRQEWVGTTTESRPSLTNYSPSGIPDGSTVTITVPWTKIATVACPVKRGLGTATQKTSTSAAPYDPIAQSFFIDPATYPDGVFVTSIGVYFKTVDQSTPVVLELRNMSSGSPGSKVFPGGKVLIPGSSAAQSPNASVSTIFRFDFPVFLKPNEEYCFVVKSASLGYNIWCSKLGEIDNQTNKVIDSQPFLGTMFMSENNYTWIPDSTQDVKFDLNVAVFDVSKTADVTLKLHKNTTTNNYYGTGQNLPLSYMYTTKNSKVVKIKIPMHGLVNNDKIYIEGIATPTPSTLYNNILATNLNGEFTVQVVDEDYVNITTTGNYANKSGFLNIKNELYIIDNNPPITVPVNPLTEAVPYINSDNLSPSTLPTGVVTPTAPTPPSFSTYSSFTVYTNIQVNEASLDFMKTKFDDTTVEERLSIATGFSTAGSETPYGYVAYQNIGKEVEDFYEFDQPRLLASPRNETIHASELNNKSSVLGNVRLTSSNKNVSPVIDTNGMSLVVRSYKIDNQNDELTGLVTESDLNDSSLNSEILSGTGNALAKYKSPVQITTEFFDKISVFVVGNCPSPAEIDVYVRTSTDTETHMDRNWTWVPLNGVYGTAFPASSGRTIINEWFYEIELPERFNVYDIKLVMRSTNNSVVPKIHGIRALTGFTQ